MIFRSLRSADPLAKRDAERRVEIKEDEGGREKVSSQWRG